ncbi:CoA pyrophosphatase [Parvularcula sp. IMCC14364]|uniref:CoA pyrophosphatase n=1 Tax=Parvularcula sp. IMCC14364 TaxID=3067902 RepID=UPI00274126C6|nr:CoA pyrophosphatase [Parvularcula sp. IMCC14364]
MSRASTIPPPGVTTSWRAEISAALEAPDALDTRSIFHELNPHLERTPIFNRPMAEYRAAAVLFPIIDRVDEPSVLLTIRSNEMPSHAGQISFPGGRVQAEDQDHTDTALRETWEEVGIERDYVEVMGDMGVHLGGMGFAVTPVIGVIHPDADFTPCPREVQGMFEVPLAHLFDLDRHIIEERENNGVRYRMPAIPYGEFHIWGLTAGIINSLAKAVHDRRD